MSGLLQKALHLLKGEQAEQNAKDYLIQQGLKLVCQNYRCKYGELDLVMQDGATLVIVEVRYRKSRRFGSAEESITAGKQAKIIAATQHYLSGITGDHPLRFDVVAISGGEEFNWIKNAF